MCVGFVSGAPKSHQLKCTLNISVRIFYTMNKRITFTKSIRTYFCCMLFHPLLSSHFIHMDFLQKINHSIRITLWAAAHLLWGVYQNFKTNFVLLIFKIVQNLKKQETLDVSSLKLQKQFVIFFLLNTSEQNYSKYYSKYTESPRHQNNLNGEIKRGLAWTYKLS